MADAIAALARVDLAARGFATSASPTAGASARCRGGASSSTATPSCPGYPGPAIPRLDDVAALARRQPAGDIRMGLIHGDFHFANVLISRTEAGSRRSWTGS